MSTKGEAMTEGYSWHADAYSRGEDDALTAASWIIDGNTKPEAIRYVVGLLDAGDPAAEDYLPARPNLSGEWSGSLTPLGLARDITGLDDLSEDLVDALAELYEAGVADAFEPECERILRAALD